MASYLAIGSTAIVNLIHYPSMKPLTWPASIVLVACTAIVLTPAIFGDSAQYPRNLTKGDVDRWMSELSNWGRWGKDDQSGTVNLSLPPNGWPPHAWSRRASPFRSPVMQIP